MKGKIALEEHIESPGLLATGTHNYPITIFRRCREAPAGVQAAVGGYGRNGNRNYDSLSDPTGVEGIPQAKLAIDTAKKMNGHMANLFVKNNPDRFLGFATAPLQDPAAAAKELERAVKELGFVGANINSYTNTGDENTARYLDEQPVWEFWAHVEKLEIPVYLHARIPLPSLQRIYQGY